MLLFFSFLIQIENNNPYPSINLTEFSKYITTHGNIELQTYPGNNFWAKIDKFRASYFHKFVTDPLWKLAAYLLPHNDHIRHNKLI